MVKALILFAFFVIKYNLIYSQELKLNQHKDLIIDNSSMKANYEIGDTLKLILKNKDSSERKFVIEAVSLSKEPYYYNAVYSAYINNDSAFFRKLAAIKNAAKEKNISFIIPEFLEEVYTINGKGEREIDFVIKGLQLKKGNLLELRIIYDITETASRTIYSKPFSIFAMPE